jgi:hypothetical protein
MSANDGSFLNLSICKPETSLVSSPSVHIPGGAAQSKYLLKAQQVQPLVPNDGECFATDLITVHGRPIGIMVRHEALVPGDSGWRFFAGPEFPESLEHPHNNGGIFGVNVLANYDPAIIPMLGEPTFTFCVRNGIHWLGQYSQARSKREEHRRLQSIRTYMTSHDILVRRQEPGLVMLWGKLGMDEAAVREIIAGCPVPIDLEYTCSCCEGTANPAHAGDWLCFHRDDLDIEDGLRPESRCKTKSTKYGRSGR